MNSLATLALGTSLMVLPVALSAQQRPHVGDAPPPLSLSATDGTIYSLSDKPLGPRVVVFFRGSW